jgi:cell division protein FtsL
MYLHYCLIDRLSSRVEGPSNKEWILLLVFCCIMLVAGVVLMISQWRRLQAQLNLQQSRDENVNEEQWLRFQQSRNTRPESSLNNSSSAAASVSRAAKLQEYEAILAARRDSRQVSKEELTSQMMELKHMQKEVRSTLVGLEHLVSVVQAKKNNEHSSTSMENTMKNQGTTISQQEDKKVV